ncbi:MAG TPA: helix-turn-helix domain-containing protein [Waddliaceae bacterium]
METILTHLQQSFATWQASSSKKRQSNASLRAQAVKCLDHYSYREVSAAIGMSVNSLRSWQKSLHHDQEIIDNPPAFVAMSLDHAQNMDKANQAPLSLQVNLPSGITIQVNSPDIKSSVAFIVALNKESQPCSI